MTQRQLNILKKKYLKEGIKMGLREKVDFGYQGEDKKNSNSGNAGNYIRYALANINDVTGSKFTSLSRKCLALLNKSWNIKWGYKKGTEEEIKKYANEAFELLTNARPEIVKELKQAMKDILSYYDDAISAVEAAATEGDKIR